jgi:hypothetical protein
VVDNPEVVLIHDFVPLVSYFYSHSL